MYIWKITAEIRTQLLIHKTNSEVSTMIFYAISNPNFCNPPLQMFLQNTEV